MAYALVGAVVHVDEEGFPVGGKRLGVDGETMVLRSDEAAICSGQTHRLVVAAVAIFDPIKSSAAICFGY